MKRPPAGQGPFQRGERLTAAKLNDVVESIRPVRVGGRAGLVGDAIVADETERAYIRITGHTGNNPRKFSWYEVYRTSNGTWANATRSGNFTYDWAVEQNDHNVGSGQTVYEAVRSSDTSEWIFHRDHGGGSFTANSSETVLMILGTYDTYKDCQDVPPKPPTVITDFCNGTRGTDLCIPAYAYAVYQRCGYVWNKIGDTRDYQVWANEMNGQLFSAWRRFVIPRWGGSITESGPDPDAECMGVAFLGTGTGSALTCSSCPPCLSSPPANVTLCLKFKTIPRPADPKECANLKNEMDANDAWGKEYQLELPKVGGYCSTSVSSDDNIFTFNWDYQDGSTLECDWGPATFDPCDPCEHWGRLYAYFDVPGGNEANCGGPGHWRGEFKARDVCNLLCNCANGPIAPVVQTFCNGCGNDQSPPAIWNVIEPGSIELVCCP